MSGVPPDDRASGPAPQDANGDPAHDTSMVVWNVPAPAATGVPATVTVGVRCASGCDLSGQEVALCSASGVVIGSGRLESAAAPETESLYSAGVVFVAPDATGVVFLMATFTPRDLVVPHLEARTTFSVRVDPPPQHRVVVRVTLLDTGEPLARVEVRLGHYSAVTDEHGSTQLAVPGGRYECTIRRIGYQAPPMTVDVTADLTVEVEAGKGETREELEARLSAWENYPWS